MPRDRRGSQLSVELPPELLQRLKAQAAATDRPVAALVRRWIEAGLAGGLEAGAAPAPEAAGLQERVVALEAAVAALEQERRPAPADLVDAQLAAMGAAVAGAARGHVSSPKRVSAIPQTGDAPIPQTGEQAAGPQGALTTAELAERTGTNRAGWNNWAARVRLASPSDAVRHHPEAGSWRLVGKAPAPGGGPDRWLWEPA